MALADGQLSDNYHARQPCNRRLALGWRLIPRFQGRGGGRPGDSSSLLYHPHTYRVEAENEPENVRSSRLTQRLGFQREGLLRDSLFVADQPRTQQMFGLLPPEWGV
jgi:RimJ/RimL family protein N-acetyltransferase